MKSKMIQISSQSSTLQSEIQQGCISYSRSKDWAKPDCFLCSLTGIRLVLSCASLYKGNVTGADAKTAFLQTDTAQRDVYGKLPKEAMVKSHYSLFLSATYALVNSNARWQSQPDDLLPLPFLQQLAVILHLFYRKQEGRLVLLIPNIVDDLLIMGENLFIQCFLADFNKRSNRGTVV